MRGKRVILLVLMGLVVLCLLFVLWEPRAGHQSLGVEFVCTTNVSGASPQALFKVTNRTSDLIICENYGYLEPGESGTALFNIPAGTGPWRVAIRWQRRELNGFEAKMNGWRDWLAGACNFPRYHRDPWLPLERVAYSAEIQTRGLPRPR